MLCTVVLHIARKCAWIALDLDNYGDFPFPQTWHEKLFTGDLFYVRQRDFELVRVLLS